MRPETWRRAALAIEFCTLFAGGPALILWLRRPAILFALLWIGALVAWWVTRRQRPRLPLPQGALFAMLLRFALLAPLIALATWWWLPEQFLSLPRQRPIFWAVIMVLYPVLSVWPQEVLYRAFVFTRYRALFGTQPWLVVASALAFGFAHVIFLNWLAIAMTTAGGWLFARDYERTRSLRLACLEHSLFGCVVFTVGLGRFFYTGSAWHH